MCKEQASVCVCVCLCVGWSKDVTHPKKYSYDHPP